MTYGKQWLKGQHQGPRDLRDLCSASGTGPSLRNILWSQSWGNVIICAWPNFKITMVWWLLHASQSPTLLEWSICCGNPVPFTPLCRWMLVGKVICLFSSQVFATTVLHLRDHTKRGSAAAGPYLADQIWASTWCCKSMRLLGVWRSGYPLHMEGCELFWPEDGF